MSVFCILIEIEEVFTYVLCGWSYFSQSCAEVFAEFREQVS